MYAESSATRFKVIRRSFRQLQSLLFTAFGDACFRSHWKPGAAAEQYQLVDFWNLWSKHSSDASTSSGCARECCYCRKRQFLQPSSKFAHGPRHPHGTTGKELQSFADHRKCESGDQPRFAVDVPEAWVFKHTSGSERRSLAFVHRRTLEEKRRLSEIRCQCWAAASQWTRRKCTSGAGHRGRKRMSGEN